VSKTSKKKTPNPVAKHMRTYNKAHVYKDKKKESKKNGPKLSHTLRGSSDPLFFILRFFRV